MDDMSGLRRVSDVLADYWERFGKTFPWPFEVGDLRKAEEIARKCIETGEPYDFEYDDDKNY